MKFEEVLPALRKGQKVKRKCWHSNQYLMKNEMLYVTTNNLMSIFFGDILLDEDWEIVDEPKPIRFQELKVGEKFRTGPPDTLQYIKTRDEHHYKNAVTENLKLIRFDNDQLVTRIS